MKVKFKLNMKYLIPTSTGTKENEQCLEELYICRHMYPKGMKYDRHAERQEKKNHCPLILIFVYSLSLGKINK